jgi:TRAP transporter TAXI family solute receptor
MNKIRFSAGILALGLAFSLFFLNTPATAQSSPSKLPSMIGISTYDVGTSTFIQAGAIGDALMKKMGTKIRVVPSGNDVSRTLTLKNKTVDFTFSGVGTYYFAKEGLFEFSTSEWGPQRIQAVWNCFPVGGLGLATAKDAGIKTPADLKGKRLWWITGSPAQNIASECFLAYANLTWKEVQKVVFASYSQALRGLIEGSVDAGLGISSPPFYELAASRRGIWWPEFPPSNKEGWKRLKAVAPYMLPAHCYGGPGMPPQGIDTVTYSFPLVVTYDWKDEELVYQFAKALDVNFPLYKDSYPMLASFERKQAIVTGLEVPFHKGAVRYFKEIGIWNQEFESWQKNRLENQNRLTASWSAATAEAAKKGLKGEEFSKFWLKKHDEIPKGQ